MSWATYRSNKTKAGSQADTLGLGRRPTYGFQIKPRNDTKQGLYFRYSVVIAEFSAQLPVSRVPAHVPSSTHFSGNRVNQELTNPCDHYFSKSVDQPTRQGNQPNAVRPVTAALFSIRTGYVDDCTVN